MRGSGTPEPVRRSQRALVLTLDDGVRVQGGMLSPAIRTHIRAPDGVLRATIRAHDGFARLLGVARIRTRVRGALGAELPAGAYVTADGDLLDEICWPRYGREGAVPHVLPATRASPTPIPCCRPARCSSSGTPTAAGAAGAEAMDGVAGRGRLAGETASRLAVRVSCAR